MLGVSLTRPSDAARQGLLDATALALAPAAALHYI